MKPGDVRQTRVEGQLLLILGMVAEQGRVYRPRAAEDYAYVVVRIDPKRDRVACLQPWSDSGGTPPGAVWEESLDAFEAPQRDHEIVRVEL